MNTSTSLISVTRVPVSEMNMASFIGLLAGAFMFWTFMKAIRTGVLKHGFMKISLRENPSFYYLFCGILLLASVFMVSVSIYFLL